MTQRYTRELHRAGPIPTRSRVFQGLGALPNTYKDFAFNTFLLFFYNQVLGLSPALASLAIMFAIVADAISDPLVGSYSDRLTHKLGRRHPLMYAAALPLGVCITLLFTPPNGLTHNALFLWLLIFSIGTRTAMTFFLVPWSALYAELTDDYEERTALLSYRFLIGFAGGVTFSWCTWTFIFPSTETFNPGQLNPDAYLVFAVVLGVLVTFFALATTHLTKREVPYLLQPDVKQTFRLKFLFADFWSALSNRDYLVLFIGLLFSSAITGTLAALEIYLNTYFWGLGPEDLRWFALAASGALLAFLTITWLQSRFDKKHLLIASMLISLAKGITLINLRLAGLLPDNDTAALLYILLVNEFVGAYVLTITVMMFISMVADTLDAQELATGQRQEGMFSAAISFSAKATTGLGVLFAGLVLEMLIGFPQQATPDTLPEELLMRMGIVIGIAIPLCYLLPFYIASRYNISRERHTQIRNALDQQRLQASRTAG
ncbi:MAG: MFS transporter [bacterium]